MIVQSNPLALYSKVLKVSGPDAEKFLQGQLCCDVTQAPTYGAYCNIKGKVECFFHLSNQDGAFIMSMPEEMLSPTLQELQKYGAFSKVELSIIEQSGNTRDLEQEILAGIPEVYLSTRNKFFPHDINLPSIDAVSFTKGCYRGQEIVARMHHRGKLKRQLQQFTSDNLKLQPGDTSEYGMVVRVLPQGNKLIGLSVASIQS